MSYQREILLYAQSVNFLPRNSQHTLRIPCCGPVFVCTACLGGWQTDEQEGNLTELFVQYFCANLSVRKMISKTRHLELSDAMIKAAGIIISLVRSLDFRAKTPSCVFKLEEEFK